MARKRRRRKHRLFFAAIWLILLAAVSAFFLPGWLRQLQYPVKMESLVREMAAKYDVDAPLIAAVIYTESRYNPNAQSGIGAMGLMQIMPETGEWIAGKLGRSFSPEDLYDPVTNVEFGAWYLQFLLNRYDGRITNTVAAYHSGQGSVDKWLQNPDYSPDGKTLTTLPGHASATRHHINKVLTAYENYQILYKAR